jgi:hypothetical protein
MTTTPLPAWVCRANAEAARQSERDGKCKAVRTRGRYTTLCSRNAKRNGYCAYHDNRPELRAS